MIIATRWLMAIVIVELLGATLFVASQAWRVVPQIPEETLADPWIMPDLQRLADAAQQGQPGGWTRLGNGLLGKGFYAHAEPAFREALRRDQPILPAQFGLAFSLDRMGRLSESSQAYKQVLTLPGRTPDDALTQSIALYALGRNALRREKPAAALEFFRQNPDFTAAIYQQAKILVRSDRAKEALPLIDEVLGFMPYALEFHFLRFRALTSLGNENQAFLAAAMMERSAHLVSLNFNTEYVMPMDAMTGTARLLDELSKLAGDEDLINYQQELREIKSSLGPQPVFAAGAIDEQLLRAAVRSGDSRGARDMISKLRQQGMENDWILEAEGDLWLQDGDAPRAAEAWQRALRLTQKKSLHQKLAAYFGDEQPERRDGHWGHAALLEGISAYRSNQLAEALKPLKRATELLPNDPAPWYYIGEMHFHLGQTQQALQAYQRCLAIRPSHGRAVAKRDHLNGSAS